MVHERPRFRSCTQRVPAPNLPPHGHETTIEWLAQGKSRNWKYEDC